MILKKLESSILVYALFIMVVITIIIGSIILLAYLNNIERKSYQIEDKLRVNVNSGIALMLTDSEIIEYGSPDSVSLYEEYDNNNIISIKKELWGLYDQLHCTASWGRFLKEKIVLAGKYYKNNESIALYLADQKNPLCLVGKTLINGDCILPKIGIKHAYVEGRHFERNKLLEGEISVSDSILPLNIEKINHNSLSTVLNKLSNSDLEAINYSDIDNDSISNSFYDPSIIVFEPESIIINNIMLGNLIIVSEEDVVVSRNSKLQDVLIYAKNIFIESGFNGSLQCFAQDSIIVNQDCNLTYPSTIATINLLKTRNNSFLKIESGVNVEGTVLQYSLLGKRFSKPEIIISKNALIIGQVYSTGALELLGDIYGSIFTNAFVLSKPSARYINHLLDVEINQSKLPDWFVGNSLFNKTNPSKIIKWF